MTPRDFMISAALSIHAGCTQHVFDMKIDLHACGVFTLLGVLGWEAGLGILCSTLSLWLSLS